MNTRNLVAASIAALMMIAGSAVAADNPPFPSQAIEVGGHWTGKVGRDSTPGMDVAVFPSAAVEFSGLADAVMTTRPAQMTMRANQTSPFPSAAIEVSGRAL